MINLNANVNGIPNSIKDVLGQGPVSPKNNPVGNGVSKAGNTDDEAGFAETVKAVEKYVSKVDDLQQSSDMSIKELLAGKNADINSVVSAMAKADMSFKLLVGVRNKLIEAYKRTMNMPI